MFSGPYINPANQAPRAQTGPNWGPVGGGGGGGGGGH